MSNTKHLLPALLSGVLLILAPCALLAVRQTPTDPEQAIRAVIAQTEAANNGGDVEAWVGLFATDAVYMAPGAPAVSGIDALRQVAQTGFVNRANIKIEPVEIRIAGDWAFARNAVRGTVTLKSSGTVVTIDVKQLVVYNREADGRWRIARFMSNSNR